MDTISLIFDICCPLKALFLCDGHIASFKLKSLGRKKQITGFQETQVTFVVNFKRTKKNWFIQGQKTRSQQSCGKQFIICMENSRPVRYVAHLEDKIRTHSAVSIGSGWMG